MKRTIVLMSGLLLATSVAMAERCSFIGPKEVYGVSFYLGGVDELASRDTFSYKTRSGQLATVQVPYQDFGGVSLGLVHHSSLERMRFDVSGVQVQLLGGLNQDCYGVFAGGLFNVSEGMYGVQGSLACNIASLEAKGLQTTLGINNALDLSGVQLSLFANMAAGRGLQFTLLMNTTPEVDGTYFKGCQIGLFNFAHEFYGVQFGLFNINRTGPIPFFPIINVGW